MNQEIKIKWLEALRSGKYSQGFGRMRRRKSPGRDEYCCLGVLCDISELGKWESNSCEALDLVFYVDSINDKSVLGMPYGIGKPFGLTVEQENTLITLNDVDKKSFMEIADYIEKNL